MSLIIDVPGWRRLDLTHLVLDLNGTLAVDGRLVGGVSLALSVLTRGLDCHVVTADTHGNAAELFSTSVKLEVVTAGNENQQKQALVQRLGAAGVCAMGNGANDVLMLKEAALGVAVLGPEGASPEALAAADVVAPGALAALGLLLKPERLRATLRR